jgi:lysophospholipase L1-like esterase
MPSPVLGRIGLALASTAATAALLVGVEFALRAFDLGAAADRDPLHGFSMTAQRFERVEAEDGAAVYRLIGAPDLATATFRAEKQPGAFRIFVVGGSSAAGVPYGYEHCFAAWLNERLRAELPGIPMEVVNVSASGFGTRRILNRVRQLAAFEPDLLIVYSGHNEFSEARYFAKIIDMNPVLFGLWDHFASTRLYGVLSPLLTRDEPGGKKPLDLAAAHAPQQMFFVSEVGEGAGDHAFAKRRWSEIESEYRRNLSEMIRAMQSAGARVMLLSLSQNFADWPPGASRHAPDLTSTDLGAWKRWAAEGDARAADDCDAALDAWQRALAIDDAYASLHFRIASCWRKLGHLDRARESYRLASDLDRAPLGAPTRFNGILRELADEYGTLFLDVDAALREDDEDGLVGDDHIIDVMHPRLKTHMRIAREIAHALRREGVPVGREEWRTGAYREPDVESIYAAQPTLRTDEHLVRALMCYLGRRADCVREEVAAILVLEPDHPIARQLAKSAEAED